MISFTKNQGETNFLHYNIINILRLIDDPRIQDLIFDEQSNLQVMGDIHRSQFIAGNDYPWFTIKGTTNGQITLPSTHVYVCYKYIYNPPICYISTNCFSPDGYVPEVDLNCGRWEFVNITFSTDNKQIVFEDKPKHIKEYKEKQQIIDPVTGLPIVLN